jgi:hypothetical protein
MTLAYLIPAKPIGRPVHHLEYITIQAHNPAHALQLARELYPRHEFGKAYPAPESQEQ